MKRFTRMYDFYKFFTILSATALLFSCGGGGGGGGAVAGPGPASSNGSDPNSPNPPAPASAPQNITVPVSFTFQKSQNSALSACEQDSYSGTINAAEGIISVSLPFGTDATNLIPSITLPENATISPASGTALDFSQTQTYTVTAADGTTTQPWNVFVSILPSTGHSISYEIDGGTWNITPDSSYSENDSVSLPVRGTLYKENYYFTGWHLTSNCSDTAIANWNAHDKNTDITLYASWTPAPSADISKNEIYANGYNLLVTQGGIGSTSTTIYYDINGDGTRQAEEPSLYEINNNYPEDGRDLSNFTIYGGNASITTSPAVTNTNILFTGGKVANVYGSNKNGSLPPGTRTVTVSGTTQIGDKSTRGIHIDTLTGKKATAKNLSCSAQGITLIGGNASLSTNTVVATFTSGTADAGKFFLTDYAHEFNINVNGSNIVVIGKVELPASVTWQGETFQLGHGNITTDGTIFSVFAGGGYLTLTETALPGANFDMGIPLKNDQVTEDGYVATADTSRMYRYIQFSSTSGDISSEEADNFLSSIVFHKVGSTPVTVRINLETVDFATVNSNQVTYFDGSFYKAYNEHLKWSEAYAKAKQQQFNGLTGYLMTITSEAENKFIYDKLFKNKGIAPADASAWLGATRGKNSGRFDAATWTDNKNDLYNYWNWACGPEAGQKFYTPASNGSTVSGWYTSWNSGEPNNSGTEYCAQYCGTYIWNDLNNAGNTSSSSPYYVKNYVVEFRPYSTQYGTQRAAKTALSDEKTYNNN